MTDGTVSTTEAPGQLPKATTADDLLDMYEAEEGNAKGEVAKEVEKQARVAEELPKKLAANELVKNLEKNGNEDGSEEEDSEESREEDNQETSQEEVKAFKAKLGDAEIDIPEEAIILTSVNGKDVPVKVADAVKAFAQQETFNRQMVKRTNDVVAKERKIDNQYQEIRTRAAKISNMAAQGEWLPVIKTLAKMAAGNSGIDPVTYEKQCLDSLHEIHDVYTKMSPEQRDVYFAKRSAEAAKEEANAYRTKAEQAAAIDEVEREVAQVQQQHGIPKDVFWGRWNALATNMVGDGKKFATIEDIQASDVVEFHQDVQHLKLVDGAVEAVAPELVKDQQFCMEVFNLTKAHPEFDAKDIEAIVREALGASSQSIENLNRKVERAKSVGLQTQLGKANSKAELSELDKELEETFFQYDKRNARISRLVQR